jgi:hypothetical protein
MDVVDEMRWLVDSALDRAVVPGFSNVGYRLRRTGGKDDAAPDVPRGRTAPVAGVNRGIVSAITEGLTRLGAAVLPLRHR